MVRWTGVLASVVAAFAAGCGGDDDRPAARAEDKRTVVAVIKGLDNPFFATMHEGLVATARRHDVPLRVGAAAGLQDTSGQASTLESLAAESAGCYVVNPISSTNLLQALSHVPEGTPIVNVDSPVDRKAARAIGVEITTYIGVDNVAAGRLAADAMAGSIPDGARTAVVTGIPGDVGSGARARGFIAGARGRFEVVESVAADFDRERARLASSQLFRADRGIRGVFAVNDQMALGVGEAAADSRADATVIGMDGIREALGAVKRRRISATVAQYPYAIGQLGVEACLAAMRGSSVPANVNAPVQIVTRENVARAQANFPRPVERFENPLSGLLAG